MSERDDNAGCPVSPQDAGNRNASAPDVRRALLAMVEAVDGATTLDCGEPECQGECIREAADAARAALASPAAPVSPPAPGGEAVVYAVVDKDGQFVTVPVNDIVRAKAWAERLEWMQHMEDDKPLPVRFRIVVLVPLIERTAP